MKQKMMSTVSSSQRAARRVTSRFRMELWRMGFNMNIYEYKSAAMVWPSEFRLGGRVSCPFFLVLHKTMLGSRSRSWSPVAR